VEYNLADLFEHSVDHFGDREYIVAEGQRRTYAQMEERANRLAHHLADAGVSAGDHVGIYALNSVEWVETLWAVFKLRAVWVNINYRYVEDELRYLIGNADLVALVHQRCFGDRLAAIPDALGGIRHRVVIEDGTDAQGPPGGVDYEEAVAGGSPERDFGPRSADDRYILYTGGTTGMPKGVVWRHEDVLFALGGGLSPVTGERITHPGGLVERGLQSGPVTSLPIAPLMHGATQWSVMGGSFTGNKAVLVARFEPERVWELVGEEKVNMIMITGDAMGRPLIEALERSGGRYDLSSLFALSSTAAVFSPSVKDQFLEHLPNLVLTDSVGSSESGATGYSVVAKGKTAMKGGPTVTPVGETVVFDEDLRRVEPGSGVVGKLARAGFLPLEYYKDDAKSRETFVEVDGVRYAIPGGGGRQHHPPRARFGVHQLGWREDLPRRGGVGPQVAPRRLRRGGGRRARRAVGRAHRRRGRGPARGHAHPRGPPGPLPHEAGRVQGPPGVAPRRQGAALPQRQARLPLGQDRGHRGRARQPLTDSEWRSRSARGWCRWRGRRRSTSTRAPWSCPSARARAGRW
jgi:acyl-CoA synthetase (AMP-forming)/AMP-acid ligase II